MKREFWLFKDALIALLYIQNKPCGSGSQVQLW